ncbi:conserved hypothetical protein [Verticillium alfalfae VaMs.102]|uniref:Derlin n=1 Tax=Verticillium alfalfae (strain VaMs.102 / ATCC MYA-4576 / FGSC 10136) TaxID=526221 RepID=C9S944_VERA1|nr:conserved hypothetical protein [Verticillium alfalfae VaMs.102]EEY14092.1 conserved hypothetical protein [Verticillium alfalfae VaMs.102]
MSSDMLDGYWRAPPIARTVATAAFVTSISVYLGALPAHWLTFMPEKLFTFPPQAWRIWSNFLVTGPQLSLLFDTYFLYNYTSALEVGNPRFSKKEDVIWYLLFVGGVITLQRFLKTRKITPTAQPVRYLIRACLLAFWRWLLPLGPDPRHVPHRDPRPARPEGQHSTFITIPAQLMPFAMMLMSLLFPGGAMTFLMQLIGFFAAHLFDFLTRIYPTFTGGRNLLPTPGFLSRFVETPRILERNFGTAIRPRAAEPSTGRTTGAATGGGPLPEAWRTRGPGRRLGD